ncbi:MAG: glycerol-3-phosphate acyltransferase [Trueperaceae bacterium]|nr:glycerol-3-phosphate acyltransferase [Trueperaceae bacterium]
MFLASLFVCTTAYLVGALPLGGGLLYLVTGQRLRALSAHTLGVENLIRVAGLPTASLVLLIDVIKGAAVIALATSLPDTSWLGSSWLGSSWTGSWPAAASWAAFGVYLGHLYPPPGWFGRDGWFDYEAPRGRGHGVLVGLLVALLAYADAPLLVVAGPVAAYAGVLAASAYPALATLVLVGLLPLSLLLGGAAIWALPFAGIGLLALGRHKVSLARMLDRTEPKLGDPPAIRGHDPAVVYAAFMIHPLTTRDLWQPRSLRWLRPVLEPNLLPDAWVRGALRWFRPQKQGEICGVRLSDGREVRVVLISGGMFPGDIRRYPEAATQLAIRGARLAYELGAETFGLGGFWSTVGDKGRVVQAAVPDIAITNGGAYTAATVRAAVPGLLEHFRAAGGSLARSCAAVVGANGVVAFGIARLIAPEVARLILVGRDPDRLARSADTLRRKYPRTDIVCSTDVAVCAAADLVFTATSDPDPVLFAAHVKPGAWLFDLGRPADVDAGVRAVPGVHLIPGGVVRPPGAPRSSIDLHFGDGLIPACLAETMILGATRAFGRASIGPQTRQTDIDFYLHEGARLGFEIVTSEAQVIRAREKREVL